VTDVFERYRDALRQGHVAARRGRPDQALAAYIEAATLAPERSLPHASIGGVYLGQGRFAEAVGPFTAALDRMPTDEAALAGRAEALAALGRRADAATDLDRLAAIQDAAARSVEALGTACRALELAESRARRATVAALVDRARAAGAPEAALEPAIRILGAGGPDDAVPVAPPPDPEALESEAEAALAAGDAAVARDGLLRLADAYRAMGRPTAALDAGYRALAVDPASPEVHLTLAELYLDRGWRPLAVDKLVRLARLSELRGDDAATERVRALVRARLADDPRARELIA